MSDPTAQRRMRQEFEAWFPRPPQARAALSGDDVYEWLKRQAAHSADNDDGSLGLKRYGRLARDRWQYTTLGYASVSFVLLVDSQPPEEADHAAAYLRDLITGLEALPDWHLLAGCQMTLSFEPGRGG